MTVTTRAFPALLLIPVALGGCAAGPTTTASAGGDGSALCQTTVVTPGMLSDAPDLRGGAIQLGAGDAYGEMVHAVYLAYQVQTDLEAYAEAHSDAPE